MVVLLATAQCSSKNPGPPLSTQLAATLRVGVGAWAATSPIAGLQQLAQLLSTEVLMVPGDNGRPQPQLAESWSASADRLTLDIKLRPNARFQDGAPVDASTVTDILKAKLSEWMGPIYDDVAGISAMDDRTIQIRLRRRSNLVAEALELPILKRDGSTAVGTGPFVPGSGNLTELKANDSYYLGRPKIDRIIVSTYPTIRAAWADMLRGRLDLLPDVSTEAIDSLTGASNVKVLTFTRHYQYVLAFNRDSALFRDVNIRRALNGAIDRSELVRRALSGFGVPSAGPIWPHHWALSGHSTPISANPSAAAATFSKLHPRFHFVCLVPPELDQLALELKRQLAAVGVDLQPKQVSIDQLYAALSKHDFDAALSESISGPSIFRPYYYWHSKGPLHLNVGSQEFDSALDRVRYAESDEEYRKAVEAVQKLAVDDPPALFLAWSEGVRAVSTRFEVAVEPGRDPLATLSLWHPTNGQEFVNRN